MYTDCHWKILFHPLSSEQQPTMIFKFASLSGLAVLSARSVVTVEAAAAASGDKDKMHGVLKEVMLKGVHSSISVRNLQSEGKKKASRPTHSPTASPSPRPTNSPTTKSNICEDGKVNSNSSQSCKEACRGECCMDPNDASGDPVLLSQERFAKMVRAAWVIEPVLLDSGKCEDCLQRP